MRTVHDQTTCPACGSWRIACTVGTDLDMCVECHACWERVPPGEHFMVDGEVLSFRRPCDNCAFRGKSPERQDKERWDDLQLMLAQGGEFYCHKGVPFAGTADDIVAGGPGTHMAFEFPQEIKTFDLAGETIPHPVYIREHMRMCRGWLNKFVGGRKDGR